MAKITITHADGSETKFGLSGNLFTVGRAGDNDIVLPDGSSSNYHAVLKTLGDDSFSLTDLGSMNLTRVNGTRITTMDLQNEDRILFGDTLAVFHCDPGSPKSPEEAFSSAKKDADAPGDKPLKPPPLPRQETSPQDMTAAVDEDTSAKPVGGGCLGLLVGAALIAVTIGLAAAR